MRSLFSPLCPRDARAASTRSTRRPRDPGTSLAELLAGLVLLSLLLFFLKGIVSAMLGQAADLEAQVRARSERATLVRLLERTVKDATALEGKETPCPAEENASPPWSCAVRVLREEFTPNGEGRAFVTSLTWDPEKGALRIVRTIPGGNGGNPSETPESIYAFSYLREVAFRPSGDVLYVRLRLGNERRTREETFAVWTAVRP